MYEDTKLMLENAAAKRAKEEFKYKQAKLAAVAEAADRDAIWDKLSSRNIDVYDRIDFKQKVNDAYVIEALTILVDNCLSPVLLKEEYHQKLVRQLVSNFVMEEGSYKILRKMRSTSYLMSEMAYAIDTTVQSIFESSTGTKPDSEEKRKEFYKKLEKVDAEKATTEIASRVRAQQEEFVTNAMEQKAELAAALSKTEEKVADNKAELAAKANSTRAQNSAAKIEESYIIEGKRKLADIRSSASKNIFECMVYSLAKSAMVNESASAIFLKNSKINMDKIVEHVETLCTFITTLDSVKLINVDEAYIEDMLKSMKK